MSQEKLNHVVTGVLFDFMGYLTTRKEKLVLSASDDASPAVEAIKTFLEERNIEDADPLFQWEARCTKKSVTKDQKRNTPVTINGRGHFLSDESSYAEILELAQMDEGHSYSIVWRYKEDEDELIVDDTILIDAGMIFTITVDAEVVE